MRIGMDVRPLQGPNRNRGIGRYIKYLLRGLREEGIGRNLILFVREDATIPAEAQGSKIVPVPTPLLSPYERYFRFATLRGIYQRRMHSKHRDALAKAVRQERLDVLHLPSPIEADYFTDAGNSCPTVATLHDLIPLVLAKDYIDTWMDAAREVYHRQTALFSQFTMVAAISNTTCQDAITRLGVVPEKAHVIFCALPADRLQEWREPGRQEAVRQKFNLETPYFLYCSGSGPNKNLPRIVDAYALYANHVPNALPLVLAGKFTDEDRKALEERGAKQGLKAQPFRFLGFVADDDLWVLLASATALVTVSLYEGFGLPAAEAMAVGTPVLASNVSSYPEVVGEAGVLVPPDDVRAIAQGMARLAGDDTLRATCAERGQARFFQYFTLEQQAKAFLNLYTLTAQAGVGKNA